MDKPTCMTMIKGMLPDLMNHYLHESDAMISSGAIDLEAWEDNYALPKLVLTAVLRSNTDVYAAPARNTEWHKDLKNLEKI